MSGINGGKHAVISRERLAGIYALLQQHQNWHLTAEFSVSDSESAGEEGAGEERPWPELYAVSDLGQATASAIAMLEPMVSAMVAPPAPKLILQ